MQLFFSYPSMMSICCAPVRDLILRGHLPGSHYASAALNVLFVSLMCQKTRSNRPHRDIGHWTLAAREDCLLCYRTAIVILGPFSFHNRRHEAGVAVGVSVSRSRTEGAEQTNLLLRIRITQSRLETSAVTAFI